MAEENDLVERLRGRALYLHNMRRVKSPDLMYAAADEIERLRKIEAAAKNLAAQKGRHHTQQAYERLAALVVPNVELTGVPPTDATKG